MISLILEATTGKRMRTEPFCQEHNCSPVNVFFNDVYILLGVSPLEGLKSEKTVCENGDFQPLYAKISQTVSNTATIRPTISHQ